MRVLPLENEAINECWLSDKDRFSYEGLNTADRLRTPMVKQGGEWKAVDWQTALDFVAQGLTDIVARHGPGAIGALVSPHSTLEELTLAARLVRGARQRQHRLPPAPRGFPRRGRARASRGSACRSPTSSKLDRVLVVGSFLRKDASAAGATPAPGGAQGRRGLDAAFGRRRLAHAGDAQGDRASVEDAARARGHRSRAAGASSPSLAGVDADGRRQGDRGKPQVGQEGRGDPRQLRHPACRTSRSSTRSRSSSPTRPAQRSASCTEAANTVGAHLAGALPQSGGMHVQAMLAEPRKAYVVMHAEPEFDFANARRGARRDAAGGARRGDDALRPRQGRMPT